MQNISKLTEQQRNSIIGQKFSIELIDQYDWSMYYPMVNDDMIITDILCADDIPEDIVIDASNNYARRATDEELEFHRENPTEWPNTVIQ
jgi:hypothetical protein